MTASVSDYNFIFGLDHKWSGLKRYNLLLLIEYYIIIRFKLSNRSIFLGPSSFYDCQYVYEIENHIVEAYQYIRK